jgi:hypothetical protein
MMLKRIDTIDKDPRPSRDQRPHATSRLEEQMARENDLKQPLLHDQRHKSTLALSKQQVILKKSMGKNHMQ